MMRLSLLLVLLLATMISCNSDKGSSSLGGALRTSLDHAAFDRSGGALADIEPYVPTGPYANVIAECARASNTAQSCTLATLPPIAMSTPQPGVADIMQRVVVSHPWMGQRFEQLLEVYPQDLLTLFGAVTAVVIDADIRPSYYTARTGAIYLDPFNLWLTPDEKDVISRQADYRAAFADPMNFRSFWRVVIDNQPAYAYYSLDSNAIRSISDISIPMAALLFHELAHANDILSPLNYSQMDMNDTVPEAAEALYSAFPSTQLQDESPLESDFMFHIASILYSGVSPNADDVLITAAEVGDAFAPDRANDDYAYTSQFEDFAMLFEEAMMKFHFDVDRDTAFVSSPGENAVCNDYRIGWGVRGRIGEERVKVRAARVIQAMLPNSDYSQALDALGQPIPLTTNAGWCESIVINNVQTKPGSRSQTGQQLLRPDNVSRPYLPLY